MMKKCVVMKKKQNVKREEQEEKAIISYDELLENTGEFKLNYVDERWFIVLLWLNTLLCIKRYWSMLRWLTKIKSHR